MAVRVRALARPPRHKPSARGVGPPRPHQSLPPLVGNTSSGGLGIAVAAALPTTRLPPPGPGKGRPLPPRRPRRQSRPPTSQGEQGQARRRKRQRARVSAATRLTKNAGAVRGHRHHRTDGAPPPPHRRCTAGGGSGDAGGGGNEDAGGSAGRWAVGGPWPRPRHRPPPTGRDGRDARRVPAADGEEPSPPLHGSMLNESEAPEARHAYTLLAWLLRVGTAQTLDSYDGGHRQCDRKVVSER